MIDQATKRLEERRERDKLAWRRIAGFVLLVPSILFLPAILSWNWRDLPCLCMPPLNPPANLLGRFGAWTGYYGYMLCGVALWIIPFLVLFHSFVLIKGRTRAMRLRTLYVAIASLSLCGLAQLGSNGIFAAAAAKLNLGPNAGGAFGYWLATCSFERWIGPGATASLFAALVAAMVVLYIGPLNILQRVKKFHSNWKNAQEQKLVREAEEAGLENADEHSMDEIRAAAKRAKEEARAAREAERQRNREEREKARAQRNAEREQAKAAARAAKEKAAADRDYEAKQKERERLLRERQAAARAAQLAAINGAPPVAEEVIAPPPPPKPEPPADEQLMPGDEEYAMPTPALLDPIPATTADHGDLDLTAQVIVDTLEQFNVKVEVVGRRAGPVVTQFELRPAPNVKVERIASCQANLQMNLAAKSLRIEAPIPGKQAVGIEVPNRRSVPVTFHELLEGSEWKKAVQKMAVPLALGKDVAGNDLVFDLAKAPHLLVAGSTGSGKSVCLNCIINGLLMSRKPEELRMILVDPKRVEFVEYNDLPHLLVPVINDAKKVAFGLRWAIVEMQNRYKLLQKNKSRNIASYNAAIEEKREAEAKNVLPGMESALPAKLPYIVIIIDEVADIMASVGKEVEPYISKLCALSRAVGIHLILATQRPSVDVITGTIKSNIPGRIAFKVAQANDSRTILDNPGAEELIGKGDMLFLKDGSALMRAQGAYVADDEVKRIVEFIKTRNRPCYDKSFCSKLDGIQEDNADLLEPEEKEEPKNAPSYEGEEISLEEEDSGLSGDELLCQKALDIIRRTRRASASMLQRRLSIGYNKAARIMDMLQERGIVGEANGSNAREILVDLDREIPSNPAQRGAADGFSGGISSTPDEDTLQAISEMTEADDEPPGEI